MRSFIHVFENSIDYIHVFLTFLHLVSDRFDRFDISDMFDLFDMLGIESRCLLNT